MRWKGLSSLGLNVGEMDGGRIGLGLLWVCRHPMVLLILQFDMMNTVRGLWLMQKRGRQGMESSGVGMMGEEL